MDSFPTNDEFYKLELIFKLTTDLLGSSKILCLIELYLKDDGGSFSRLTKVKDDFTLIKVKVSFKLFSNHDKSVTKMPTIRSGTSPLSGLCSLLGDQVAFLA